MFRRLPSLLAATSATAPPLHTQVIKQGLARDVIPSLAQAYGPAGLLFLDHW